MRTNQSLREEIEKIKEKNKINKTKGLKKSLAKLKISLFMRYNSPLEVILVCLSRDLPFE